MDRMRCENMLQEKDKKESRAKLGRIHERFHAAYVKSRVLTLREGTISYCFAHFVLFRNG